MIKSVGSMEELFGWASQAALSAVRTEIRDVVIGNKSALVEAFYGYMMENAEASRFLSVKAVEAHLKPGLEVWLETLLCHQTAEELDGVLAMQRHVGEVHARAQIPLQLVARGMRLLKREISARLVVGRLGRDESVLAVMWVIHLIDVAFETMSSAFEHSREGDVRTDEAYRMSAAGSNLSLDRERQIAVLREWESRLFRAMAMDMPLENVSSLHSSGFGLWLDHKAALIFDNTRELALIGACVGNIDGAVFPAPDGAARPISTPEGLRALIKSVTAGVDQIVYLLNAMFDRLADLEVGRDVLTQLFNRRFLPTIMKREIDLGRRTGTTFCVLLLDVDLFKEVNDRYGHDAGDKVLQNVAGLLLGQVRISDFVFRYGGEEFLIVLAEVDETKAHYVAEKIRRCVEASPTPLSEDRKIQVTLSIGLAQHDGHPDFSRLVERADKALYQAKASGRNRTVVAAS